MASRLTKAQAKKRLTEAKMKVSNVAFYTSGDKMSPAQYRSFLDDCTKAMKMLENLRNKLS